MKRKSARTLARFTRSLGKLMPRYAFDILTNEGRRVDDTKGVILPNDEDAYVYAVQIVEELKRDDSMEWMGSSLELRQGTRVVALIPFHKAH